VVGETDRMVLLLETLLPIDTFGAQIIHLVIVGVLRPEELLHLIDGVPKLLFDVVLSWPPHRYDVVRDVREIQVDSYLSIYVASLLL